MKAFLFAIVIFINACSTSKTISMISSYNPVVAHRGAFKKNNLPENSLASLTEAIRIGCAGAEFDVRITADDTLVVNHDPDFAGLDIERNTYAELSKSTLANGEKLPTLHEYLVTGLYKNKRTRLVLEIKPSETSKERGKQISELVLNLVSQLRARDMLMYISFDYDILKNIHQLDNKAHTQYLSGDKSPEALHRDGINGADYHYSVFLKNPAWVAEAKQYNISLNAWTVNEREDLLRLVEQGFDFITTNEPELLMEILSADKTKR